MRPRNPVIEMTHSASGSLLGPEFDDFLYAPIGEEKNGMLLSVLSALARLDLDPWQEATELAGLPRENATQRLASLIATLPGVPSAHFDPGTIAAGLIARLPHRPDSNIPRRDTLPAVGTAGKTRAFIFAILWSSCWAFNLSWQAVNHPRRLTTPIRKHPAWSRLSYRHRTLTDDDQAD